MNRIALPLFIVLLVAEISIAQPNTQPSPQWPAETQALFRKWMEADRSGSSNYEKAYGPALAKLAAAPDADLCFLRTVDDRRSTHDWLFLAARDQMGKLNTQRTFDIVSERLKSGNWGEREEAIGLVGAFKRPESVEFTCRDSR